MKQTLIAALSALVLCAVARGGGDPVPVLLKNGDASLDNAVNLVDMNLVLYRFNSEWSGPQDLDGDGWVGLSDLNIVLVNFALVGDDLP